MAAETSLICITITILALIPVFIAIRVEFSKQKSKNRTAQQTSSKSTYKNTTNNTVNYLGPIKTLEKYYNICKAIVDSDDTLINSDFEILCFLYFATIYTVNCKSKFSDIDIEEYTRGIDSFTLQALDHVEHPDTGDEYVSNTTWLEKRTSFYNSVIAEKFIRGEWMLSNPPEQAHPLFACSIALGDVLRNPYCVEDYKNAPWIVGDIFDKFQTQQRLSLLCNAIREYSLLIINHKT